MKRLLLSITVLLAAVLCFGCSKDAENAGNSSEKETLSGGSHQQSGQSLFETAMVTRGSDTMEDWVCPDCGTENNTRFCTRCGAARPENVVCPSCGSIWPGNTEMVFCGNCGAKLDQETAPVSELREPARIFLTKKDDLPAHTILIPGQDGDTIYIRELHISYVVVDGFATIEIPDHIWYDNHTGDLNETMEVILTPFLKTSDSGQEPLDPITYTIDIPLSPITLETPDSLRATVTTTMSVIKIIVRPGSTVTINGYDYSDIVSPETGELTYNASVQPIGDNVFDIVVRSPYCRENSIQVVLFRERQEIPLDLAAETPGFTNDKTMKVTAATMPGAYVEVKTPYSDLDITELNTTGKFSFNAVFDKYGDNTITIIASYPGKKSSQVDHVVHYVPSAADYTMKAWPLGEAEYAELLGNLQYRAARSQIYVIKGVVQYTVTDKPQRVVIYSSADGKSQPVVVENYSGKKWEVGKYYRLFGDVYSTYDNMPWFNVRYTYEQ